MSGAEKPKASAGKVLLMLFFWGVIVASCVGLMEPEQDMAEDDDPIGGARYACRENIRAVLASPSSAEWGHWSAWAAEPLEGGVVRVMADFEASNAYGVQMRTQFLCEVRLEDGSWYLEDLREN